MPAWDRLSARAQARLRDQLIREQLRDGAGAFSPYWRDRLRDLRISPESIKSAGHLARLPTTGERDVCPDGDPRGAAALVQIADEAGFARHSPGPHLRKALLRRFIGRAAYRRLIEAAVRPTSYHWAGHTVDFPVASTRDDLDLIARAGARAWRVLGLTHADVLVSGVPVAQRLEHMFLFYAALAAGAPALFPRTPGEDAGASLATALRLMPATVLALPVAEAVDLLADIAATDVDLSALRSVLLVGYPSADQRLLVSEALMAAGAGTPDVLSIAGPPEGRVMWAECREGAARADVGLHTYPDLEWLEVVDAESGETGAGRGGELVLTQLGFRGSALVRWRTGDLLPRPLDVAPCPACRRTVPRIPPGTRQSALVPHLALDGRAPRGVDLRAVADALAGRADVADWRVEITPSRRGGDQLVILITPTIDDVAAAAVGVYRDVRLLAGIRPTQVVTVPPDELPRRGADGELLTSRIRRVRR